MVENEGFTLSHKPSKFYQLWSGSIFHYNWRLVILRPDSPLRKIPVALERKQAFFLEGIRVSLEIIEQAHSRLQDTLLALTNGLLREEQSQSVVLTSAISDAWLVIDSFHRLADLAEHIPNVIRRSQIPFFHNLIRANNEVNELRNVVQHLPGQIHKMAVSPNWSVWGVLSWAVPPDAEGRNVYSCSYFCGKFTEGQRPLINPLGRPIRRPVGLITLTQESVAVSISELFGYAELFAAGLEQMIDQQFQANPLLTRTYASDVLICLSIAPAPTETDS